MRRLSVLLTYPFVLFKQLFATGKEKTLIFPEVGWTITIPKNFWLISDKKLGVINKKVDETLAAVMGKDFEANVYKHLFTAREMEGFFAASITSLAEILESQWAHRNDDMYESVYKAIKAGYRHYQHVSIDTHRDRRQKDQIIFDTFEINVYTPTRKLSTTRYYTCVINNYGLTITTCYEEEKSGDGILDAIRNSVFSK